MLKLSNDSGQSILQGIDASEPGTKVSLCSTLSCRGTTHKALSSEKHISKKMHVSKKVTKQNRTK
jgi:hypothetical protein